MYCRTCGNKMNDNAEICVKCGVKRNVGADYCQVCGFDGEIKIVKDDGKLVWECPKCGNRDQNKLNVARRTCGLTLYSPR